MLEGLNVKQKVKFVSKYDTTEPKTEFYFKPLSGAEMLEIKAERGSMVLNILDTCIVEIKNMPEGMTDKREYLRTLRPREFNELFDQSDKLNNSEDDERKNS